MAARPVPATAGEREAGAPQGGSSRGPGGGAGLCTRRRLLGGLGFGLFGLGLPDLLRLQAGAGAGRRGRARSCIFLFLGGGASHIDIWDLKPDAPVGIRGEFKPVATSAPGVRITEHLPLLAARAHHLALVRSLEIVDVVNFSHHWGFYYVMTGHRPEPGRIRAQGGTSFPLPGDWPFLGSVVAAKLPPPRQLPAAVQLPWVWNTLQEHPYGGNFGGRLGRAYDPFVLPFDPRTTAAGFASDDKNLDLKTTGAPWETLAVPDLTLPAGVDAGRFLDRRRLLALVDDCQRTRDRAGGAGGYGRWQERAFGLLTSPEVKRALNLDEEPAAVRERYGRSSNGQCALLARRLVEAGVPFINLQWLPPRGYFYNWDTHENNFRALKVALLPVLDRTLSALLDDLETRGLLDTTLVVVCSDMGRTPRVGDPLDPAGRNHWGACQTAVLAGGGVRGGQVYGASDQIAAYPKDNPARPEDLAATVYHALGVEDLWARDVLGRPVHLLEEGRPLPLFG